MNKTGRIIGAVKPAFPFRFQRYFLAAPFAAAGGVIVLLFVWMVAALSGFERVGDSFRKSPDNLPAALDMWKGRHVVRDHSLTWFSSPRQPSAEERLAASANLLDFVESIRENPVSGGHYLALKAYDFCTREARLTLDAFNDMSDQPGAGIITDGRQMDAQARLTQLCGTFRNRQLLALDYYLIVEEGVQAQDPRMLMARRMEKLSAQWDTSSRDDFHSRQTLIADVLGSGDGAMVRDLAGELEVILHSGQMVIAGRTVSQAESADVIDALRLIACEQGAACTRENEWQQVLACASAGECSTAPAITHVNAMRWREQIREAMRSGLTAIDVIPSEQRY